MSTGFTPEEDAILAKWLCAGCYGAYFLAGFFNGITAQTNTSVQKTTTISLTAGGISIPLTTRTFSKLTTWNDSWFDPHGWIFNGPIDSNYASYWGDLAGGQTCWGDRERTFNGSYDVSSSWLNTEIYFADLREDILVYYQESGSHSASSSGDTPMGQQLAYAAWNGAETAACRGVNITDAIKLPVTITKPLNRHETITRGPYTPYQYGESSTRNFNVAASDIFGSVNDFAVIDQSKPYDCAEGSYTELIEHERLDGYRNSWNDTGSWSDIDDYDESIWIGARSGGVDNIPNGTYDYPSFININPLPRGSWAVDAAGNYFYSMLTRDMHTFNKLNTTDPNSVTKLPGNGIVFYPVAPS